MTPSEFREMIERRSDAEMLAPCLTDDAVPFAFDADSNAWSAFRRSLAAELEAAPADIRLVGSGRLGFSLKPRARLRAFRETSDLDLLVVSASAFDAIWQALLEAVYPRGVSNLGPWIAARRNEVYTGWVSPTDITLDRQIFGPRVDPLLARSTQWFNALKKASAHVVRRHESIKARLYRTWRHAELYHLYSLSELRESLAH